MAQKSVMKCFLPAKYIAKNLILHTTSYIFDGIEIKMAQKVLLQRHLPTKYSQIQGRPSKNTYLGKILCMTLYSFNVGYFHENLSCFSHS